MLAVLLWVFTGDTHAVAQALGHVPASQTAQAVSRLNWKLLPPKTSMPKVDRSQVVQVHGTWPLLLLPVRYSIESSGADHDSAEPPATHFACGIVAVTPTGAQQFVATMGMPDSARETEECTALRAIGAAEVNRPDGDLILIYRVYVLHAPPAENFDEAVLLTRDAAGQLHVDEMRTAALSTNLKTTPTIANVRRELFAK